jgi:hypothetical protein
MKIKGTFLHNGNSGDIIASLPALKEYYRQTNIKPFLYLQKDVEAFYYEGAVHPVKNDKTGKPVMLNDDMCKMLIPLLKAQPYIRDAKIWDESEIQYEDIACDLSQIREIPVGMPALSINRWYFYLYPDLACDLSKQWLFVPPTNKDYAKGKIVITRTERYQNGADYSFLKPYEDDLIFSGTMREYNNFRMSFNLEIRKLTVNTFLDLAHAINQCKFHITNQTMANQISTGLMHPSLLEVCDFAPNCIPIGADRYDFLHQPGLEYSFHKLNGTLDSYMAEKKATIEAALKKDDKVL